MSQQSLEILNPQKYSEEFEEIILYNFDNYFMQKHFRVGSGVEDRKELKHALLFHRILCTDNCNLSNYILDKISGKLDAKKTEKKEVKKHHHKHEEYSEEPENFMFWSSITW